MIPLVAILGVGVLLLTFIVSVSAHIADPARLQDAVADLGLSRSFAFIPVAVEGAILALLVLGPQIGATVTIAYLCIVMVWIATRRLQGFAIQDCGCFRSRVPADRRFFLRNALLLLVAAAVAAFGPQGIGSSALVAAIPIAAAAMLGFSARLSNRREPDAPPANPPEQPA